MAIIELKRESLRYNYKRLDLLFRRKKIKWAVVTKLLCGNELFLKEVLKLKPKQICDSRISNLRVIKRITPKIETIFIKPTPKRFIDSILTEADISFNTSIETIKALSQKAAERDIVHKIVIMMELGELREGVMRERFMDFYQEIFELKNIEIVGIGANLSCLYGVLPNADKLIQLSLFKELLELKFKKNIPLISGGSSVTLPLIFNKQLPKSINHFRIGETLFFGTNVYDNKPVDLLKQDVFTLKAEIIELIRKPIVPIGEMGTNVEGKTFDFDMEDSGKMTFRAILDIGILDIDRNNIFPKDDYIEFFGASSDMLIIDLKENPNNYRVGDYIEFDINYMGVLSLMNSNYIEKRVI